jgi:hypothetical protein
MDTSCQDSLAHAISGARKQLLDLLETTYGTTPQWAIVRRRVLKTFGRDGLERFTSTYGAHLGDDRVEPSMARGLMPSELASERQR